MSVMVHQDSTIGITTRRDATSHLPPAGIPGGALKICSWFLAVPPTPFSFCAEPIRRAQATPWAIFLSHGSQEMHNWRKDTDQWASFYSPLFLYLPLFYRFTTTPLHTFTSTHTCKKTPRHKGNEIEQQMSCVGMKDLQ